MGQASRYFDAAMFFRKFLRMKAIVIVPKIITKESALMTGEIPYRTIEKTYRGSVVDPGPETKNVMTKSSRDMVIDIMKPERIPGMIAGTIGGPRTANRGQQPAAGGNGIA